MKNIRKEFLVIVFGLIFILGFSFFEWPPVNWLMNWKARRNANTRQNINVSEYEVIDHTRGEDPFLTVDFLHGIHFWHPQVVIWIEDSIGNYVETLLVTTSTAKGLFYGGRSADNYKEFDLVKQNENTLTRRVDALPYWSHKRGVQYNDGLFSPPPNQPLPDGISSATPSGNFYFKSDKPLLVELESFRVMVEVNVAFDENEYYSEYDFVDDSLYHGGTGLLGQPSLIYGTTIHRNDKSNYYVLDLLGHGHHSGRDGNLYKDLSTLTTARFIVERIVVGVNRDI